MQMKVTASLEFSTIFTRLWNLFWMTALVHLILKNGKLVQVSSHSNNSERPQGPVDVSAHAYFLWNFIRYHEEKWQYARDNCGEIC
jgi:hypothetical protein